MPSAVTDTGPPELLEMIGTALSSTRFNLSDEKILQQQIAGVLEEHGLDVEKEYPIPDVGVIDFFVDGLGIEVKIKGRRKAIYRQCEKYCEHESIQQLLLVTNVAMGLPATVAEKPLFVLDLSRAHL